MIAPEVEFVSEFPIETELLILKVVPVFTARVLLIVLVPLPENVTVPAVPTVKL